MFDGVVPGIHVPRPPRWLGDHRIEHDRIEHNRDFFFYCAQIKYYFFDFFHPTFLSNGDGNTRQTCDSSIAPGHGNIS